MGKLSREIRRQERQERRLERFDGHRFPAMVRVFLWVSVLSLFGSLLARKPPLVFALFFALMAGLYVMRRASRVAEGRSALAGETFPVEEAAHPEEDEIARLGARIREAAAAHGLAAVMAEQLAQVDDLVHSHGRLAGELSRLRGYLAENPPGAIAADLADLDARLAEAGEATRPLLEQNRTIVRMRLEKLGQIQETAELLRAQLGTLADTLKLIHDQVQTASSPAELSVDLRSIRESVAASDEALAETRALMAAARLPQG